LIDARLVSRAFKASRSQRSELSDDRSPQVMVLEAHEEFIQQIESGSSKIRALSLIVMVVTVLLIASFLFQLALPYYSGTTTVAVNLLDPALQAAELSLVALAAVWFYVGIRDYFFTRRMTKAIREIRELERELEKKITG
jgi:hypothetical protein